MWHGSRSSEKGWEAWWSCVEGVCTSNWEMVEDLAWIELGGGNGAAELFSAVARFGAEQMERRGGREMNGQCLRKEEDLCTRALHWAEELVGERRRRAVDRATA